MSLADESERSLVLTRWNRTATDLPAEPLVHRLFEHQARRSPHAAAVAHEGQTLSYQDLNTRSNQVAHFLRSRGVGPEARVGLQVDRSANMAVGLLGILKSGGAYVPLDPSEPTPRRAPMVDRAGVEFVLTTRAIARSSPLLPAPTWSTSTPTGPPSRGIRRTTRRREVRPSALPMSCSPPARRGRRVASSSPSVGREPQPGGGPSRRARPRRPGAPVLAAPFRHRRRGDLPDLDREPASSCERGTKCSIHCGSLAGSNGKGSRLSTSRLRSGTRASTAGRTPARHPADRSGSWSSAGSRRAQGVRVMKTLTDGQIRWINTYRPTQATVIATSFEPPDPGVDSGESELPIGTPLPNCRVYVLDRWLRPVPIGLPGELYIGGMGVGRGYVNQPAATAERFVPDPFSGEPGARLYRTGDRVRWRRDGQLLFLGRIDSQAKIRGFRVELGEVEAALGEHPDVNTAAVVASSPGEEIARLDAFLIPREPGSFSLEKAADSSVAGSPAT